MTQPLVSIVIPFFNEEKTVEPLLQRLDETFTFYQAPYEIIAIDDNSSDGTLGLLHKLKTKYPVTILHKPSNRPRGKAFSLLEGFQKVRTSVIVMIDGDLQYPPEAIPQMLAQIDRADVIVANRIQKDTSVFRRFSGFISQKIFAELFHGVRVDAQSGLKVIRREVIQRITLNPTRWTFDIELLVKAKQSGYVVDSLPITMEQRRFNKKYSPIRFLQKASDIARASLHLRTKRPDIIPFLPEMMEHEGQGFHYKGQKYISHSKLPAHETALYRLTHTQRWFIFLVILASYIFLLLNWHATIVVFVAALTTLYFIDLLFNLYLIYRSFSNPAQILISDEEIVKSAKLGWPSYTIFCPLYKEHEVIPQFVKAMSQLDYPKEKLQVMLLLEADDKVTVEKALSMDLPDYFEIVIVPDSLPKTKPKACNYGLLKARGEYCVIYDAEDVPDKDQLKKAIVAFRKLKPNVACVQAQLNFYNPHQNLLTRAFTAEYSLWFDLILTGLQSINAPIPLGGTSNHFRTQQLVQLHGWDAFNVTEDCDLGIRLVKKGMYTAVLDSTTLEEANSDLPNWLRQRSRWIKGYMQTYLVHMRNPKEFLSKWSEPHAITFQLIVGGKILSMFINPFMWLITISYFTLRAVVGPTIESFFPSVILYMAVISLVFGNFLYFYYYMIGSTKRKHYELIKFAFLVPFYWLAMSIAAWIAVKELILRPHHWAKTTHGLHLTNQKGLAQTNERIGSQHSLSK